MNLEKNMHSIIIGVRKVKGFIDISTTTVTKDIFRSKNKSQAELAEEINVTRQALSNKMNRDKFSVLELMEISSEILNQV